MLNVRDGAGDVAEPCRAPEHSDKETVVPWPMEERACSERARDHKIFAVFPPIHRIRSPLPPDDMYKVHTCPSFRALYILGELM